MELHTQSKYYMRNKIYLEIGIKLCGRVEATAKKVNVFYLIRYKRKMQHILEVDNHDDNDMSKDSSKEYYG